MLLAAGVISAYGTLRLRSVPAAALRCLRAPQHMVLYSIDASSRWRPEQPGAASFHRYRVLGQADIVVPGKQRAVTNIIERAIVRSLGLRAMCFNPQHAVRVSDASGTYDFLICFECAQIYIYSGDKEVGDAAISGWQAPLDHILEAARVPLAPTR